MTQWILIEKDPCAVLLLFGDSSQYELTSSICEGLGKRALNLAGQTSLRELAALIKLCSVILTNDSGPMHLADALDVPLVALFGSTSPILTGPYKQRESVIQKKVPCAPCFKRRCPIDFPCMKKIETEEVLSLLLSKIEPRSRKASC